MDSELQYFMQKQVSEEKGLTEVEIEKKEVDAKVFEQIYIPRTLTSMTTDELEDIEEKRDLFGKLTGMNIDEKEKEIIGLNKAAEEEEESEGEGEGEEEDKEKGEKGDMFAGMSKHERKTKIKEMKREKRINKVPKHIKKAKNKKRKHN